MTKVKMGTVISNAMNNTVVVRVDRMVAHKLYGKRYRVSKKFLAHDETGKLQMGDTVTIQETKPMSKRKTWVVVAQQGHDDTITAPKEGV